MAEFRKIGDAPSILLNLIRFLSSQGVLVGHSLLFFGVKSHVMSGLPSYCVLVFFILSGFLISQSITQRRFAKIDYGFKDFIVDRFFRIYPPFLASLVFVLILDLAGFRITGQYYSLSQYLFNFFINMLQLQEFPLATFINEHYMIEFFRFHYFGSNLPLWTIGIEWWLYLFYGYIVLVILPSKRPTLRQWIIVAFLAITPVYYMIVGARMEKGLTMYWFLGVVLMLVMKSKSVFKGNSFMLLCVSITIAAGMYGFPLIGYHSALLLLFFGMAMLLWIDWPEMPAFKKTLERPSEMLAGYSYSLYLIHYPILVFITGVFSFEPTAMNLVIVIAVINIIAFLFATLFEKRTSKLKLSYENYRSGRN